MMNMVQRSRGIKKIIRKYILGRPGQKFVVAGSKTCRRIFPGSRSRFSCSPSDSEILAWARYDTALEAMTGFWNVPVVPFVPRMSSGNTPISLFST